MKVTFKTKFLLFLRKNGWLCKLSTPTPQKRLRISHTVYPDNSMSIIDTEIYHYLQNKKSSFKNCLFDAMTRSCACGVVLDNFGIKGCPNKSIKNNFN